MAQGLNRDVPLTDDAVRLAGQLAAALTPDQRVVVFTGTAPEAGVTTVVAQLALAFARMSQEAILVLEADAPGAARYLGFQAAPATPGLTEVLEGSADLDTALCRGEVANLWLLSRGRGDVDVIQLLGSEACQKLLAELRLRFRLIVIDSSPILRSAPTSLLASRADGVVVVVAAGRGQRGDLIEIKRVLEGLKVSLLGAVLTSVDERAGSVASPEASPATGRRGAE